jgi:hypothetical protein
MKKITVIFFVSCIFLAAGCSDVLDKYPLDKPSQETFYTNATEIARGVNACYAPLQETGGGSYAFPIVLDCMSDNGFPRQVGDQQTIAAGEHDDKTGWVKETWTRCYQGIGRCNNILKVIQEKADLLTEAQVSQFRGEALFLRAYYYGRLALYYGAVPLTLEPITTVAEATTLSRTPQSAVVDQAMADFTEAAGLLPKEYAAAADKGRATIGTANAYKARYALYFGRYDVAAEAAKAVIDSKVYALYPQYGNLFISNGMWDPANRELILVKEFSAEISAYHQLAQYMQTRNTGGWACMVPSQNLMDSYHCIDGKNIAESPLFDKNNPWENRDPRLRLGFVVPGDGFGDYCFDSHVDSTTCLRYSTGQWVVNNDCYTINQYTSYTGYYPRKFSDPAYITKNTRCDYPLILCRYAEVLLTYAEARVELNQIDQSVVDALNHLRQDRDDVKMPPFTLESLGSQQQARIKVRHERKIELAFEGFRYADLRRWGWANIYGNRPILGRPFKGSYAEWPDVTFDENDEPVYDYNRYEPHPSKDYRIVHNRLFTPNKHELWPIPESERILNPSWEQNP